MSILCMVYSGRSEQPGSYFVRVAGEMGKDGFVACKNDFGLRVSDSSNHKHEKGD